ncbi:MAG: hypothetical protein R2752_19075 [Vicinamibacterales bacterium]
MADFIRVLLIFHFIGLTMGFTAGFSGLVMARLMAAASPDERGVLARVPPAMSRIGDIGLVLLWLTGLGLLFLKWGGFGAMPGLFHAKITAVVILSGIIGYMHVLMRKARQGDAAAAARLPLVGRAAMLTALTALVLAVLTFE